MALNFPSSPTPGTSYTSGNTTWIFDGTVWNVFGVNLTGDLKLASLQLEKDAEPTANANQEGKIIYIKGTAGVSGSLRICVKLEDDTYEWVPLF